MWKSPVKLWKTPLGWATKTLKHSWFNWFSISSPTNSQVIHRHTQVFHGPQQIVFHISPLLITTTVFLKYKTINTNRKGYI